MSPIGRNWPPRSITFGTKTRSLRQRSTGWRARSRTCSILWHGRRPRAPKVEILNLGNLDPGSVNGKLILTVLGAIAAFEREMMLERQREGIARAKAEGKYKGRKPTARNQANQVRALAAEGVSKVEIARRLGMHRASVYRALAVRA